MSNSNSLNKLTVLSLLGIVFIVLKLIKQISWAWVYVLTPFMAEAVVILIRYLIVGFLIAKHLKQKEIENTTLNKLYKPTRFEKKLEEARIKAIQDKNNIKSSK